MPFNVLEKEYNQLTPEQQGAVTTIIQYYIRANARPGRQKKNKVLYGIFRGGLNYIADDFDDTPEVFEEYM